MIIIIIIILVNR